MSEVNRLTDSEVTSVLPGAATRATVATVCPEIAGILRYF